jgi:hypothetical protein
MRAAIVALVCLATGAYLSGCSTRDIGIVTDPLPPVQPLQAPSYVPSPTSLNPLRYGNPRGRIQGEHQADVVASLAAATGSPETSSSQVSEATLARLIDKFEKDTSDARKAQVRNEIVGQILVAAEDNCAAYLKAVRGSQVASRTSFDILTSGLTTAGAIASPERSARLLAALGSASNGIGASFDRDVFAEKGVELVAQEIDRVQTDLRTAIEQNKKQSYADWDLGSAIADISTYHNECSMLRGLARVQDAVANRDSNLKTVRQVVARVIAAGGTANQVNAALAGVVDAASFRPPPTSSNGALSNKAPSLDVDVSDFADKSLTCLLWAEDWLNNNSTKTEADLVGVNGPSDFQADCINRNDAFAKIFLDEAGKALSRDTKLQKDSNGGLEKKFATMRDDVQSANAKRVQQIVDRRQRTWQAAASMAATESDGSKARKEILSASGSTLSAAGAVTNDDPALLAAAGAATSITTTTSNAPAVAGAAQGALQGYFRGYAPLTVRYTPPPPPPAPADKSKAVPGGS